MDIYEIPDAARNRVITVQSDTKLMAGAKVVVEEAAMAAPAEAHPTVRLMWSEKDSTPYLVHDLMVPQPTKHLRPVDGLLLYVHPATGRTYLAAEGDIGEVVDRIRCDIGELELKLSKMHAQLAEGERLHGQFAVQRHESIDPEAYFPAEILSRVTEAGADYHTAKKVGEAMRLLECENLQDVLQHHRGEWLAITGFGPTTFRYLEKALTELGFELPKKAR